MSRRPVTVRAGVPLAAAARLLAEHGVTALPVVDDRSRVVGVISEADVIAREDLTGPVADAMGGVVALVHPEAGLADLRRIFARTVVKSLPVVDAADHVVGVVSRSDVVRALARDDETLEQDVADVLARARVSACRVQVRNGVVQLTGLAVPDGTSREAVLDAVVATPGVTAVRAG
ncbi:CBS domain-containing protein [Nocardioides humi]|nr:CBS domain-containing protein [Nocardioides humi]